MLLWQQRILNEPPVCTLRYENLQDVSDLLIKVRQILEDGTKVTEMHSAIGCEMFLSKKLAYKSSSSLRNEKSFQGHQQILRSLCRLVELNIAQSMKRLLNLWPSVLNLHHAVELYLPSQQMVQFLLVRLIGYAALLHQIINRAALTFSESMIQIAVGMQTKNMIVFAAMASRIWFLCRSLKKQAIASYMQLRPLLDVLLPTKAIWLPDGFEFPVDLMTWLGEEIVRPRKMVERPRRIDACLRMENNKNKSADDGSEVTPPMQRVRPLRDSRARLEDIGEVVQRESMDKTPAENSSHSETMDNTGSRVDIIGNGSSQLNKYPANAETGTLDIKLFCSKLWLDRVQMCNTIPDLLELMQSFQQHYSVKSKRYKACLRQLKVGNIDIDANRRLIAECLKKVAQFQVKKKALEALDYPELLNKLETTLSSPRGIREDLLDFKKGCLARGALNKWPIPQKAIPRVKKILKVYLRGVKNKPNTTKVARKAETAEKLAIILAGPQTVVQRRPLIAAMSDNANGHSKTCKKVKVEHKVVKRKGKTKKASSKQKDLPPTKKSTRKQKLHKR